MQRIMIVGQPGSGKSFLARKLGEKTNLPVVHIDRIHWQSGWIERPRNEKDALCEEVHNQEQWIFEGGHSATWPQRLARADTLIWLDFPIGIRYRRVIWRTLRHFGKTRPDLPAGCPEQFNREFFQWIWKTRHSARKKIEELYNSTPLEKQKHHLRSRSEVNSFLNNFREPIPK